MVDLNLEVDVNLDFAKSKSKFMILLDHVIYFCISLIVLLLYYNTQGKLWIQCCWLHSNGRKYHIWRGDGGNG